MSDTLGRGYDLVAVVDQEGRFVYASPSTEAVLGYAPEELRGTVGFEILHPDDVARATVLVARQLGEDDPDSRIVRVRTASGDWVRLEGAIYPIGGDSALARHLIVTLRDVDAREAEGRRELATAAQLEAVLRNAPVGIGLVDREHRFVFVNEELASINGVPVGEHVGRTLDEVLPELASTLIPLYDGVLDTAEAVRGLEIVGETAARPGEQRFWEASYHPVPGTDGTPEGVIAVVQETTSARREELERARLQRLVEASSDFVAIGKADASVVYQNPAARRLAGFAPDEDLSGRTWSDFADAEDLIRFANEILPALEATGRWEGPAAVRNRRSGERTVLEFITFLYEDPELGPLVGAIARDQSDRRAAEARARESSQALETLWELSPVPIISLDLDRNVVRANPATEAVFGWSEQELVGKPAPLAQEQEGAAEIQTIRREMREARVTRQDLTLHRRDGSSIRVTAYVSPQFDAAGEHSGSIGFIFEVEEREQALERAERSSRQQEAVAELGLFALGDQALETVFDRAVRLVAERLGVEYAKVLELRPDGRDLLLRAGVGWQDGLVGAATIPADASSQAGYTIEVGGPVLVSDFAAETRFSGPALLREHGVVSGVSTVINGENGPWGVLGAHTASAREFDEADASFVRSIANVLAAAIERERTTAAREDALLASSAKTDFLSRVSHELRTPLNAIVGFGQLLAMDETDTRKRESVDQILAAGLHLVALIDELLNVSQIEAGAIELTPEPVDIVELADEVVALVRPLADERAVRIEVEPTGAAQALTDRRRLRQVLLNLVSNAIKYNRDGGSVTVVLGSADGRVTIDVRDTGLGIAEHDIERIFAPFHRVPGAARVEGTGLGLAVARGLVEIMGGAIRVQSTPGAGTVFTVTLPAKPHAA